MAPVCLQPVIYRVRRGASGQLGSRHHVLDGWEGQVHWGGPAVTVLCPGLWGSAWAHAGSLPASLWTQSGPGRPGPETPGLRGRPTCDLGYRAGVCRIQKLPGYRPWWPSEWHVLDCRGPRVVGRSLSLWSEVAHMSFWLENVRVCRALFLNLSSLSGRNGQ